MPRPMRVGEKPKDFKASVIKIFNSLGKFKVYLITSIILALISAMLATYAPNRLSDLTDVISEGIKPNTKIFKEISTEIYKNIPDDKLLVFNNLSIEEKVSYLQDIIINNTKITVSDQITYLDILATMNMTSITETSLVKLDKLPKSIYSLIKPTINMTNLKKIAILLAIIYIINSILTYISQILLAFVSNKYAKKLRSDIEIKINKLPLKYFDNHETGDLLSRVTNDVDSISMNLNNSLGELATSIAIFLGSTVMMFITNGTMALTAIIASIFGFILSIFILKRSQKYFVMRQKELGDINAHIEEIYSGHSVVKTYNGEREALKEFDEINNRLYYSNKKSQFLSGIMQPLMGFIGNFGYVAVCVVGALLVMNNKTTFGTIVAFMIYIRMFTQPLSRIAQSLTGLQSAAAAGDRVFEFLAEDEMVKEKVTAQLDPEKVKGKIEFKDVKFGYDIDKTIINDFSALAKPGQKIAIVGPTGAGKTTMVNLLMRFYEINSGDILIDNTSTKDLSRKNIHDLFIMVLQDTWLFEGSIRDNIKFNKQDVSDEEIWEACKTVGIDHFIRTLPGGLNSVVGDNDNISQGQKQLLTIARGMIKDAPFLILDEATSNVDTRTEELVQIAMDKLTEGRTSFIIAHRLSTIKNADLILVMDQGNIIEQGTHEDLLKKKGFYANLYNSQFEMGGE